MKLTLELIVTMTKARRLMIVIETGMYDLKIKGIDENIENYNTIKSEKLITFPSVNKTQFDAE